VFRRRRGGESTEEISDDGSELDPTDSAPADAVDAETTGLTPRPNGPWDVTDVPDADAERFDLGGLQLAIPEGAQVQLDVAPDGMVVPTLFLGEAAVQVSAFAAPRRSGIWVEIRTEIADSLQEAGGEVAEAEGTFGTELHGTVPVELPDGSVGLQPARFVGVDGPRWFLRGLFTGEAVAPGAAGGLEDAFRATVVVRGSEAMAPRDPLPVSVPREIMQAAGVPVDQLPGDQLPTEQLPADQQPALAPFERGPEITEVR
jgi:Protein of unknown function (DUF3710)